MRSVSDAQIDAAFARLIAEGQNTYPGIALDPPTLAPYVADCLAKQEDDLLATLERLPAADVCLAHACACGDPAAIARLDTDVLGPLVSTLERRGFNAGDAKQAVQELRIRLFAPADGSAGRITQYAGAGALSRWLRVSAVNLARNAKRDAHPERRGDAQILDRIAAEELDPELAAIRAHHSAQLRRALEHAFGSLAADERTLLRLHMVDGMSLGELGTMMGVNKSTLSRRVRGLVGRIVATAIESLRSEGLAESEAMSLMKVLQLGLDRSLDGLLRDPR